MSGNLGGQKSHRKLAIFCVVLLAGFLLGGIIIASADSGVWVGGLSNLWAVNGNWNPSSAYPNGSGQTATFDNGALRNRVVISQKTIEIGSIEFLSEKGFFLDASTGKIEFDNVIRSARLFAAAGKNTVTGPIHMQTDLRITNDSPSRLVISGTISGSEDLIVAGSGETVLAGNNINTDFTYVDDSTLILGSDTAAGLSKLVLYCEKPCTNIFPTATLGNLGQKSVINNPVRVKVDQVRFIGPGDMAFTSPETSLFQDTVFDVEATTSFAYLGYKGLCGFNLLKRGSGTLNLDLHSGNNPCGILANQIGAGRLNLYGSGSVGPVVYNAQTGGGEVRVGDNLDVVNSELHKDTGLLTVKGLLAFRTDTAKVAFDLNGPVPGISFDQIVVQGDIILNNPELEIHLGFTPTIGTRLTLMTVDKVGVLQGTFRDLPDGSVLMLNGLEFVINYTSSEVTLTRVDVGILERAGGNSQSTVVTTFFPQPLQVKAVNSDGTSVAGLRITYAAPFFGPSTVMSQDSAVTDINGVASLQVRANTVAGSYQVTANVPALSLTPVVFDLTNMPDVAARFRVSGFENPAVSGTAYPFTVTSVDIFGNYNPAYLGTVRFVSDDPQAVLPPDYTFTAADAGTHTFAGTLKQAGTHFILAVDVANSTRFGLQANIIVISGGTAHLSLTGLPSVVTVGQTYTFAVETLDSLNNLTQNYHGTVVFSSDDSLAELPASFTFPGNMGKVEFNVVFKTIGVHYLRVTDINDATITGELTGIQVQQGLPAALLVDSGTGQLAGLGAPFMNPLVVKVVDGAGNPLSGIQVTFTPPSSGASCTFQEGTNVVVTDAQGKASLHAVANLIEGRYTVVAQSGALSAAFDLGNVKNFYYLPLIFQSP